MDDAGRRCEPAERRSPPLWSSPWEACLLIVRGYTVRTAVVVSAVVGTLLSAVNEGAAIASGRFGAAIWVRVATNYLVPFVVASVGYLSPFRRRQRVRPMTPSGPATAGSWRSYLDWFHERRAGITEDILVDAVADEAGTTPYRWLLSAAPRQGVALDLACGSAPLELVGTGHRWVGIDRSRGELARASSRIRSPLLRGDAACLPFPDDAFDLVACSMALMLFDPVEAVLAEIRRVLLPGGSALFLLPGSFPLGARDRVRYARLLAALRELQPAYVNRVHRGRLGDRLARAGFAVVEDDRRRFRYPLRDERATRRFVESLYAPGVPPERVEAAVRIAARWVGSEIGVPLRRLVCEKAAHPDVSPAPEGRDPTVDELTCSNDPRHAPTAPTAPTAPAGLPRSPA